MKILLLLCLILLLSCWVFPQQRSSAPAGVSGFISRVALLEVERQDIGSPVDFLISTQNGSASTVRLASGAPGKSQPVVRLLVRSNSSYELQASLLSSSPSLIVTAFVESVKAAGPGVKPGAVERMRLINTPVGLTAAAVTLGTGPRASAGGSAGSRSNAVEIEVKLEVDAGSQWYAEIQFSIKPL
jgi:hypothetical protein